MISFAAPWALAGLIAAAIPVLLHLVARREPPTVEFPAVRYLEDTARRHQRRMHLQHWLLLVVRTLLIIAVVLAAAGPSRAGGGRGAHAPAALVVILDNSLSSAAISDGVPLLEPLRAAARDALARATSSDDLWLVAADGVPRRGGPSVLRALVDSLAPFPGRLDLGAALALARELLATTARPGGILVLSDLQASALSAADGTSVLVAAPAAPAPRNLGLAGIETGPQPWTGPGRLTVSVAGESDGEWPVTLALDGRPLRQALVGPEGPASAIVAVTEPGWHVVEARLDPDELRLDDDARIAIRVADPVGVTWPAEDRHLAAASEVLLANRRIVRGDQVTLGGLGRGASVVLPPADPASLGALNRALAARGVAWRFGPVAGGPVRTDSAALLDPQEIRRRHRLEPVGGSPSGVLVRAGGEPWLVRSGDVVLVGSRLDPEWTSLPVAAAFMPFMDALVNRVARGEISRVAGWPGGSVMLPDVVTTVVTPAGPRTVEGGGRFTPAARGLHWLLAGADTIGVLESNSDPRESDLRRAGSELVSSLWPGARLVAADQAGPLAFSLAGRTDLRAPLLWAALVLGLLDLALGGGWRRRET